jgi:histidinol-phosphate aminotransferase
MDDLTWHGDREVSPGLTDLAVNVTPRTPDWLRAAIDAVDLTRYPDQTEARAAIAARHGRAPAEVLLTAGAAEAFVLLARALTPRRAVVVHPQFTEPEAALRGAGHAVERVVLPEPFRFDPAAVPLDADLVVIGNPTNPTSVLHPGQTIAGLARPGRVLVVDEAFADCVPGEPDSLAARVDLPGLVVIRSLTKTWGLAGLRIGYLLAPAELVERLAAAQPRWPVSAPALAACVACCSPHGEAALAEFQNGLGRDRAVLLDLLATVDGIEVVPGAAASFVLLHSARRDLRERLREHGFAVRRGETFPGLDEAWIRVAVRDPATSARFVAALAAILRCATGEGNP